MKLSLMILALLGVLLIDASPLSEKSQNYEVILEPPDLQDDLDDFMTLIPKKKIEELFFDYLAEDEDIAEALDYVMSEDFKKLLIEIESIPDLKEFLSFLEKSGLNAYGFVNKINDRLGIKRIQPQFLLTSKVSKITGGLPGFFKDIKALLPIKRIEYMYYQKLKNSKAFASLVKRIEESQGLVDKLAANAKLKQLIKKVETKGVEVQVVFDLISSLFGIKFPPRSIFFKEEEEEEEVIDILKQIWSHVPMDRLTNLIIDYVVDDADFQDLVAYMLADEFKNTQLDVEKMPEFKALAKYLDSIGMDIYEYLNAFHDLIGLPPIKPIGNNDKITGKLPGFIKDIRAMLPIDDLYKFFYEKMETSRKFREFVNRLETKELQDLVTALGNHKGFNSWLKRLQVKGVDLDELIEIVEAIIGIKFPKPPKPFIY